MLASGLSVILASLIARAQDAPPAGAAPPAPPEPATVAPPTVTEPPKLPSGPAFQFYDVGFTGAVPKSAPQLPSGFRLEVYGALLPFLDHVSTGGATAPGFTGGASQVQDSLYTGINAPARFRMTAGTSAIGFRGT